MMYTVPKKSSLFWPKIETYHQTILYVFAWLTGKMCVCSFWWKCDCIFHPIFHFYSNGFGLPTSTHSLCWWPLWVSHPLFTRCNHILSLSLSLPSPLLLMIPLSDESFSAIIDHHNQDGGLFQSRSPLPSQTSGPFQPLEAKTPDCETRAHNPLRCWWKEEEEG